MNVPCSGLETCPGCTELLAFALIYGGDRPQ